VSFAQYVLTEEQQEASSVIVNRSAMLLNHTDTLDNVRQAKLFATGQERYSLGSQEFFEVGGDFFGDSFGFAIV
jgi:L-rhamnose isomerase